MVISAGTAGSKWQSKVDDLALRPFGRQLVDPPHPRRPARRRDRPGQRVRASAPGRQQVGAEAAGPGDLRAAQGDLLLQRRDVGDVAAVRRRRRTSASATGRPRAAPGSPPRRPARCRRGSPPAAAAFGTRSSRAQKPPTSSIAACTIGSFPPLPQAVSAASDDAGRAAASFPEGSPVLLEAVAVEVAHDRVEPVLDVQERAAVVRRASVRSPLIVCRVSNGVDQRSGIESVRPLAKLPSPKSSAETSVLVA